MASISIINVIVSKLCRKKKLCLIILRKVDKGLKIDFYCTILPFDLTVCLWVKDGKKFLLDIKEIA